MIGSFWNLCRACPSMPVDKLHSEYRSTYRWHEYRGGNKPANGVIPGADASQPAAGGVTQGAGLETTIGGQPVVRRAPLPSQNANGPRAIEPAMPRRKKYPGVAYKTNELFDGPPAGLPSGAIREGSYTLDRARSMERSKYLANKGERRSKSEGPRNALPNGPRNWTDTVEEKATSPSIAEKMCVSSEYRNQFAWPRDEPDTAAPEANASTVGQPKKSASMGALKAAQQAARRRPGEGGPTELEPLMNHTDDDEKRYIEDYMKEGDRPQPAPRRSTFRNAIASFRLSSTEQKDQAKSKGYKSEYKKKFRPFSHYVFEASKGTFTKRRAIKKEDAVDGGAGGTRGAGPPVESKAPAPTPQQDETKTIANHQGVDTDSWYREVLDLRKRAGEYKYRGWGTELAPDHLTELYNKQMDLWYQVSRRSSLSALSLASTNHRVLGKDEKESESRRTSPSKKPKSFRMAPHQSMYAKLTDSRNETPSQRAQRRKLQGHSFDNTSVSEGKTGRLSARTSPRKQLNLVIGGRGASVEPSTGDHKPLYRSPKRRPRSADPKPLSNGPLEERRRPSKPTGLALKKYTPSEDSGDRKTNYKQTPSLSGSPKRKANRARVGITIDDDVIPLRTGSAFRDHRGTLLDDSPVVKSPPEPTRVKSPEQMNMRSPDPVNWTVPLDTGKTFTVSQTVKSDDLIRRPGSDFRGQWGGDDPHSASLSAPLDHTEGSIKKYGSSQHAQQTMPSTSQQELASVHASPSTSKHDNTKLTPPKTVEISQQPIKTGGSKLHAKTPTSPPTSLTPIDETKVLDVVAKTPVMNGGNESNSETYSSPTTEHRKSITSPINEQRKSITSPINEERKSIVSPTIELNKSPSIEVINVTTEQPKLSTTPVRLEDPTFEMASILKSAESSANNNNNFKPTEATQKSHGGVDTSVVVAPSSQASIAAEVLERARTRFDQFWGKKEGNDSV